jgi:HEAT repeat protein
MSSLSPKSPPGCGSWFPDVPLIRKDAGNDPPLAEGPLSTAAALLARGTVDERWLAARSLADHPGAVGSLAAALAVEPEARVREAILTGLVRQGGDLSVRAILPQIRSEDARLRTEALDALHAMPQAVEPYLRALLADADPDVRLLSCDLARVLPAPEAARRLCELLDHEPEANVCASALDALAEIGGPDCLPALARCAARFPDQPFLDFAVRVASQRIGAGPSA